ncbi:hypothetical protein ACIODS_12280 [Micromonospora chalcea]|uniref:hypothetical protein n=1 Tax=Micromonospora chalcea TaxID=1874 RepID=UPI0037F5B54C
MSDVLSRIDNSLANLCPCGADPRPGSPYCGPDCEPTPMRWRPDLEDDDPWADTHPVDQRRPAFRAIPPEVQQTWQWWCPTCQQPLPGPRWHRVGQPDGFAYHELDGRSFGVHRIRRREDTDLPRR